MNIINALKEEKLPLPKFEENAGYFRIRFKRVKWKGSQKSSQKSSQKIIELIKEKPLITIEELSNQLNISDRAIKKQLAKLKEKGLLKRIGPDKGGYWKVEQ